MPHRIKPEGSEVIKCPVCRVEKTLYYDNTDRVVSEDKCNCYKKPVKINGLKPLDFYFIKLNEVLKCLSRKI